MSESDNRSANAADRRRSSMVRKVAIPRRSTGGCREHPKSEIVFPMEGDDPADLSSEPGENAEQECDSELEELATRTLLEVKAQTDCRKSSALPGYVDRGSAQTCVNVDEDSDSESNDVDRMNRLPNTWETYKTKDSHKTDR